MIYFVKRFRQIQGAYISCTITTNQTFNILTCDIDSVIATNTFLKIRIDYQTSLKLFESINKTVLRDL